MTANPDPVHLVQLLLPLRDNDGQPFPPGHHASVRQTLTTRFGGLTAYARAPAEGLWAPDGSEPARDDVVVYEVMVDVLEEGWWDTFRRELERRFAQDEIVVRALAMRRL